MNAYEWIDDLERRTGESMGNGRLRFHVAQEIKRLVAEQERIKADIQRVLSRYQTFDPKTQKAIQCNR